MDKAMAHYNKFEVLLDQNKNKEAMDELLAIIAIDFPAGSQGTDGVMLQVEAHIYLGEMYIEQADAAAAAKDKSTLLDKAVKTLRAGIGQAPDVDERTYDSTSWATHIN